jgi:hypothetical protein
MIKDNPFEDLMYRAELTAQGCWDQMDDYDRQAIEKFSQLIVAECADIAHNTQYNHGRASYETGSCARAIKKYFGVGE